MINYKKDGIEKTFTEEQVIDWVKATVCDYIDISISVLRDHSRQEKSTYARKLYWYFLRCKYGIPNQMCANIGGSVFEDSAVIIQSEIVLMQKHYNKDLRYDLNKIEEKLTKLEELA